MKENLCKKLDVSDGLTHDYETDIIFCPTIAKNKLNNNNNTVFPP